MIVEKAIIAAFVPKQVYLNHIPQGIDGNDLYWVQKISDINVPSKDRRSGFQRARISFYHKSRSKQLTTVVNSHIDTILAINHNSISSIDYISQEALHNMPDNDWTVILDFEVKYYTS